MLVTKVVELPDGEELISFEEPARMLERDEDPRGVMLQRRQPTLVTSARSQHKVPA
jgi:hypothetical protein